MKNKNIQRIILILLVIMMFCTSPVYAMYTFTPGTNTITVDEYKNGVFFSVNQTGIYAISILPVIEDYEWKYSLKNNRTNAKVSLALVQDGYDADGKEIFKLYSKTIPYVLLKAGETYKLEMEDASNRNKLIESGSAEEYVTINISNPITNEDGKYYECGYGSLKESIKFGDFPLKYDEVSLGVMTFIPIVGALMSIDNEVNEVKSQQEGVPLGYNVNSLGVPIAFEELGGEQKADLVQQLLTNYLVDVIGDGIMFLIGVVAGEPITIDKIIFNEYSRTRLAFFDKDLKQDDGTPDPDKENPFLSDTGILPIYNSDGSLKDEGTLNKFFNRFTMIAIIVYLIMLLYMGIRIVLSSTGKDMAKYKKLFFDWVGGIMILFLFPYVIRYTIKINNAIVGYIGTLRNGVVNIEEPEIIDYPGGLAFPFSYVGSEGTVSFDYMSIMRQNALETGRIVYALCWFIMIKELVGFLITYMKRLLTTMFLIVIFPLVTISYAIDKIGDGKSQAFNNWVKEFILNVFLQTFHAINYVVVMGIIFAIGRSTGQTNFILIILGLTYLAQGDKIIRGIFSQMKGGGGGTVKDVAESFFATTGAINMMKSSAKAISAGAKSASKLSDRKLEISNKSSKLAEKRANDKWDEWNLKSYQIGNVSEEREQIDNSISNATNIILDGRSSAEHIQQAVGQLRQNSVAGGEKQASYEAQMEKLKQEDPEKYNELMELMEESDSVDALDNMEEMTEAELNTHLNVIIKNSTKKGNMGKLNDLLEKKGISKKRQEELQKILKARELTGSQQADLQTVRNSICTKEDAKRLAKIKALEESAKEITGKQEKLEGNIATISAKREEIERNMQRLESDFKVTSGKRKKQKKESYEKQMAEYKKQLGELDKYEEATNRNIASLQANGLSYEDRKKLFEINEEKKAIEAKMTNKHLTTKALENGQYDKNAQIAKYRAAAQMASGEMPSELHAELAEAQAVIDGSDSGMYSLDEIFEATQTVKRIKRTAKGDKGVEKILEISKSDSQTAKPDGFEEQVAALVVKNKKIISGSESEVAVTVAAAKKVLKETAKEGGVYQHILDDSGLALVENSAHIEEIVTIHEEGSLKQITLDIAKEKAAYEKEKRKIEGAAVVDNESAQTMRKELFSERLHYTGDVIKGVTVQTVKLTGAMATAGMYAGAAGDYSVIKTAGAGMLGAKVLNDAKDDVVDFTTTRIDKFTDKISGIKNGFESGKISASKPLDATKKILDVAIFGDDNQYDIKTRNQQIEQSRTASAQMTQQEKEIISTIEKKREEMDRIEARRERLRQSIDRMTGNANNTDRQYDITRQNNVDRLNNTDRQYDTDRTNNVDTTDYTDRRDSTDRNRNNTDRRYNIDIPNNMDRTNDTDTTDYTDRRDRTERDNRTSNFNFGIAEAAQLRQQERELGNTIESQKEEVKRMEVRREIIRQTINTANSNNDNEASGTNKVNDTTNTNRLNNPNSVTVQLTQQEREITTTIEKKIEEIEQMEAKRERLKQSINRATNNNSNNQNNF